MEYKTTQCELELRKNLITIKVLAHPHIKLLEKVCTELFLEHTLENFPTILEYITIRLPKLFNRDGDSGEDSGGECDSGNSDDDYAKTLTAEYLKLGLIKLGAKKIVIKKLPSEYQRYSRQEWVDKKKEYEKLTDVEKTVIREKNEKLLEEIWSAEKIEKNLVEVNFEEFIKNKAYQPDKNQSDEENKKYIRLVYDRKWTTLTDKINPDFS